MTDLTLAFALTALGVVGAIWATYLHWTDGRA
jgi:hypothetical protein